MNRIGKIIVQEPLDVEFAIVGGYYQKMTKFLSDKLTKELKLRKCTVSFPKNEQGGVTWSWEANTPSVFKPTIISPIGTNLVSLELLVDTKSPANKVTFHWMSLTISRKNAKKIKREC